MKLSANVGSARLPTAGTLISNKSKGSAEQGIVKSGHTPWRIAAGVACALGLSACSKEQAPTDAAATSSASAPQGSVDVPVVERIFDSVSAYPGAVMLCDGHATGAGFRSGMTWYLYATPDSHEAIVSYYEHDTSSKAVVDEDARTHRFELGSVVLVISDVDSRSSPARCNKPPPEGSQTLLWVAQAFTVGPRTTAAEQTAACELTIRQAKGGEVREAARTYRECAGAQQSRALAAINEGAVRKVQTAGCGAIGSALVAASVGATDACKKMPRRCGFSGCPGELQKPH